MAPNVTIVGGGSTHWTPSLLVDFANTPSLRDAIVTLSDIDPASMVPMLTIGKHVAAERKIGLQVQAAADLRSSLHDAEFVITAFSVGGFSSMAHDIEIPARHGLRQPVGDSVGPGGIFRSLRSIPVMLDIARTVESVAPEALLVNVSNPMSAMCRAVTQETSLKAVGLCNELVGLQFWLSLLTDAPMHKIDPTVAGVNHLPVVQSLDIDGQDGFALLRELLDHPDRLQGPIWMDPPEQSHWAKSDPSGPWTKADVLYNNRLKLEIFRRFGVLPGSADTHVAEFFSWFVTTASDYGRDWGVHHYGLAGHRLDKAADDAGAVALEAGGEISPYPSGELVAPLIDAMVTGRSRSLPVNVPNRGQAPELPEGVTVECMGNVDKEGVRPRDVVSLGPMAEHVRRVVASQELTVQAALSGDRELLWQAMLADPSCSSLPIERISAMTDEMIEATERWLPQFVRE